MIKIAGISVRNFSQVGIKNKMKKYIRVNDKPKLRRIADHLKLSVKNRAQNDNGYITIHYVHRTNSGCCIRIHHWNNDTLSIDLLITETAEDRYFESCKSAIAVFDNLFDDKPQYDPYFCVNSDPTKPYKRYWFDITSENDEKIFARLEKIKNKFRF